MAESFFATLECELIVRRSFRTQAEARMAIFQFIEGGRRLYVHRLSPTAGRGTTALNCPQKRGKSTWMIAPL